MTDPVLITAAIGEPVQLTEVKDHLGITDDGQDLLLMRQVIRARRYLEALTGIGLASETWEQRFDAAEVTGDLLPLGRGPVTSLTSVTASYADGTTGVMSASGYYAIRSGLALAAGASWPASLRTYEALAVRYVAGEVPIDGSPLREAVLKLAAWYYGVRGDQTEGGTIPEDVWEALGPYRAVGVA